MILEDVDPQGDRRRLVEAICLEPDGGGAERRIGAARIARGPARDVDPEPTELAHDARKRFGRGRRWRIEEARAAGATRVYWQTQESNSTARMLYDKVAKWNRAQAHRTRAGYAAQTAREFLGFLGLT